MQVQAKVRTGYAYSDRGLLRTDADGPFMLETESEEYKTQEWKIELLLPKEEPKQPPEEIKEEEEVESEETEDEEETNDDDDSNDEGTEDKAVEKANNRAITRTRRHRSE